MRPAWIDLIHRRQKSSRSVPPAVFAAGSSPAAAVSPYGSVAVWLFLSFLVFYVGLTRGHFFTTDEIDVYQQTRSLWTSGDLSTDVIPNTFPAPDGRNFAPYGAGQSVMALPLYGLGSYTYRLLNKFGAQNWVRIFAGPRIAGSEVELWGGRIEIFFVNLFNCISVAGLLAVFFAFNLRLDVSPKWALTASLMLGLTSYVAGFSSGFFQHPAEALFLLWTFYFLFCDSRNPRVKTRLLAGAAAAAMILVRVSTLALLPVLAMYAIWNLWRPLSGGSQPPRRLAQAIVQCGPFLIPAALGILLNNAVNYVKFGSFSIQGAYAFKATAQTYHAPLLVSLYGYSFSPGDSIFLFSPLLILAPWYFRRFMRRYRVEAAAIIGLTVSYLALYGRFSHWHGQWCFGPRYLMALIPPLLLPLGKWLQQMRPVAWLAVAPLAVLGIFIETLHIAVNVSYVYFHEGYLDYAPPFGYLFSLKDSQVAAHWRALLAWDSRVDMWLVNTYRQFGASYFLCIALTLTLLLTWCVWNLISNLRNAEAAWKTSASVSFVSSASSEVLRWAGLLWLLTAAGIIVMHQ